MYSKLFPGETVVEEDMVSDENKKQNCKVVVGCPKIKKFQKDISRFLQGIAGINDTVL